MSDSQDEEYSAKFDLGRRFALDDSEFIVQGGLKGRWREKSFNGTVEFYERDNYTLADALGIGPTYRIADLSPLPGYTEATNFFLSNFDSF